MKKEELLDIITEFKPDDAFVEEALGEREGAPVRVYAGKRSPMRIVAPIAASLAVAAAGFLVVNVARGKLGFSPATSIEESSEVGETNEPVIIDEEGFLEKCKEIVTAECELASEYNAVSSTRYLDIDFDGEDELLVFPVLIKGFGVRVFKGTNPDNIQDLGAFGTETDYVTRFFGYADEAAKKYYYYNLDETDESSTETIFEVFLDEESNTIRENAYLRFTTTYPCDENSTTPFTETAYRYGSEIDTEEFFEEWITIPNIPSVNGCYGRMVMVKVLDILTEKYGVSEDDYNALMRPYKNITVGADDGKAHIAVGGIDASGSGRTQIFVTFENCEQLRGFYIFEEGDGEVKLIGAFDLEGERYDSNDIEIVNLNGALLNDHSRFGKYNIPLIEDGGESFFIYRTYSSETRADVGVERYDMHKIIANADGTLSEEVIVTYGTEFTEDGGIRSIGQINGEDVSYAEANAEWERIMSNRSDKFAK